ncbi:MAG: hypothetical protein M1530_03740 [Candidatus Marsarchaeota archaeon]|nr:hypothetical protein [Candidatus Marsarchaeota archaeon]
MDINDAWKETCKVLLGDEIGDLERYEPYLTRYVEPLHEKKSALSGQKVIVSRPDFAPSSKFISNDEMGEYNKLLSSFKPDMNQIKDLDSLLASVSEHFYYSGNQITGNSGEVAESDNIIDSQVVFRSAQIWGCKYMAYCSMCRMAEYLFGVNWCSTSKYLIKACETYKQTRCMETLNVWSSSDIYYSVGMDGCSDCIFSFNRKHARNLIGNAQFDKAAYANYKNNLLSQMRDRLRSKRELPAIIDILGA